MNSVYVNNTQLLQVKQALPVSLLSIDGSDQQTVNGRDIHKFLGVARDFSTWIKPLIEKYGYLEGLDYLQIKNHENVVSKKPLTEYFFKLDVAKEIAMVQDNDKGRLVRQYFIAIEKEYRESRSLLQPLDMSNPEIILQHLQLGVQSAKKVIELTTINNQLCIENKSQKETIEKQRPLVEHAKEVLDSDSLIATSVIAHKLNITAQKLNKFLMAQGITKKVNGTYLLKCDYLNMGLAQTVSFTYKKSDGSTGSKDLLRWTEKGKKFIMELWKKAHDVISAEVIEL